MFKNCSIMQTGFLDTTFITNLLFGPGYCIPASGRILPVFNKKYNNYFTVLTYNPVRFSVFVVPFSFFTLIKCFREMDSLS